jgi:hypothetical protein
MHRSQGDKYLLVCTGLPTIMLIVSPGLPWHGRGLPADKQRVLE